MIFHRTHISPSFIDDFLRDPLVATIKWNFGWRPVEPPASVARMAFGRLRERAEVLFRQGLTAVEVIDAVTNKDAEDYLLLCNNAPPTRFAMQPLALLDAILAYGRTCPDRFEGEAVEQYQPRVETHTGTTRVLVCKGDMWLQSNRIGDYKRCWVELKATSSGRGVEMIETYRQSVQGRLYALVAAKQNMPVRYDVWDVQSDRTAFRTFMFSEHDALLRETERALNLFCGQLGFWEQQVASWRNLWPTGPFGPEYCPDLPCAAPVLPAPGRKGHWRNLFALPHGPERAAYLADNFEYSEPRDGPVRKET